MTSSPSSKTMLCVALLALAGCARSAEDIAKQRERGLLRHQYFVECMKLLPAGPQSTKYNDWDDVISECNQAAWYQANQVIP